METLPPNTPPGIVKPVQHNTTVPSYWLNWRFLVCAIWILGIGVTSVFIIWKYGGRRKKPDMLRRDDEEDAGFSYVDEAWRPSLKFIHRGWLLTYRLAALSVLLLILIDDVVQAGGIILIYYTQWTFTLVTVYFLFGSAFSIYGCFQSREKGGCGRADQAALDAEAGIYVNPTAESIKPISKTAEISRHVFQIVYQISAGTVVLTDFVFWCVLLPFFWDFPLLYMDVLLHVLNAIFLIGDMLLNSLPFPFFRIAYFLLWTVFFVIVQWIIHACVYTGWPYGFLDLSSSLAPVWYIVVGVLHLPCYGVVALILKLKQVYISKCFPNSYRRTS